MKDQHTEKIHPISAVSQQSETNDVQAPPQPPIEASSQKDVTASIPLSVIIIKTILTVIIGTAAAICISLLFCSYTYEYNKSTQPTYAVCGTAHLGMEPIDEVDAPQVKIINDSALYYFSSAVPESEAVAYDYFDDTVFIGDSRTKGLINYSKLSPYDFSSVGLNIRLIKTKAFIRLPDEDGNMQSYTLAEVLERESENYKAIYIATGLNELGWEPDSFIAAFSELIDSIRTITDVPIYIQLIIPVTTYSSETTEYGITNEKGIIFNERLIALAEEKSLFILDPRDLFTLEDGTLDPAHSPDGIHLNSASCVMLADYYRTHVVDIYAYDNTKPPKETFDSGNEE